MIPKDLPVIALIGRTNVGKSTLFNRLIEKQKALVSNIPGTTRDIQISEAAWRDAHFTLVDAGGLELKDRTAIDKDIRKQTNLAIKQADLIVLVIDITTPLAPEDQKVLKELRKSKKPILVALNKADNPQLRLEQSKFLALGQTMLPVSAVNGSGTGDLLDEIVERISHLEKGAPPPEPEIKVAIIGKPNVGKSSLLNSLVGEKRVIVSELAFTTREPNDTLIKFKDHPVLLIDTVGMRKRAKVGKGLEQIGVRKTIRVLKEADVILFVVDISEPFGAQDKSLAGLIDAEKKGLIIVANKIDTYSSEERKEVKKLTRAVRCYFPFLNFAPILFMSGMTGKGTQRILPEVIRIASERSKEVDNEKLQKLFAKFKRKHSTIKSFRGLEQTGTNPPRFTLTVKRKEHIPDAMLDILEKKIRETFGFEGTHVIMALNALKK